MVLKTKMFSNIHHNITHGSKHGLSVDQASHVIQACRSSRSLMVTQLWVARKLSIDRQEIFKIFFDVLYYNCDRDCNFDTQLH
jgi:hypothetical protein